MIEKTMEVDRMEDVISVFGSFDQNLRMIETEYNVRVTDRDEQIHITGEAENVLYAEKAIAGLLSLAAKGEEIGEQNVRYIFRLVREGREQKIQELAGDVVCITAKGKPIKAKTLGQRAYLDAIEQNTITLGVGPAGTGKTYLAVAEAVAAFRAERVNRIILTRPAVEAGERLGFLPGGIVDQHFNRRARLQRLLAAMEDAGENEGFGISEDTALEVSLSDRALRVHGSAYVMHLTRSGGTITIKKLTAAQHAVQ